MLIASAIIMTSVFGALNGNLLVGPRLLFAMDGMGCASESQEASPRYDTPARATFVLAAWSCILVLGLCALLQSDLPLFDSGKLDTAGAIKKSPFDVVTDLRCLGRRRSRHSAVASIFVFRWKVPATAENRPYRCPGYPFLPAIYLVILAAVVTNMFFLRAAVRSHHWPRLHRRQRRSTCDIPRTWGIVIESISPLSFFSSCGFAGLSSSSGLVFRFGGRSRRCRRG